MVLDTLINTCTTSGQNSLSMAALNHGGFVVIWQSLGQDGAGSSGIYGQRYGVNGEAQDTEFILSSNLVNSSHTPSVIGLADGGFVVSWTTFSSGAGTDVFG